MIALFPAVPLPPREGVPSREHGKKRRANGDGDGNRSDDMATRRVIPSLFVGALLAVAAASGACTQTLGEPRPVGSASSGGSAAPDSGSPAGDAAAGSGATTAGSGSGAGGAGTGGATGTGGAPPAGVALGPTSGRRLTRDEYLNTIADRFGLAAAAAASAAAPVLDDTPHEMAFRNDISGRTIQSQYVTAYDDAALAVAASVSWSQLAPYASCTTSASAACQNDFITKLGRLMYRRPLTPAEAANLATVYTGPNDPTNHDPNPFQTGSRLVVQAMLLSPNFLYQLETQQVAPSAQPSAPNPFEVATRLSMLFWKSGPDGALLDAAAAGKMTSAADIGAQLGPMLADPRARRGVRAFADDWLGVYVVPNRDLVASLTTTLLADMRSETLRFVERLAIDDQADLMQLFLDKKTELSPALAKLYGLTPTSTAPSAVYDLGFDPNRIGILTQPAVLGVRAGPAAASIAQRGHWILNTILCQDIDPPTQAALDLGAKVQASLPPTATERDFFMQHEAFGPACQGCHSQMDPLGFPFVTYNVAGAFMTKDANGNVLRTDGTLNLDYGTQPYKDVVEFSGILAKSPTIDDCLVRKYVQYLLGRTITIRANPTTYTADLAQVESLLPAFRRQGRHFGQLAALVVASPIFSAPARDMFP